MPKNFYRDDYTHPGAEMACAMRVRMTEIKAPRYPIVDIHNHLSHVTPGEDRTDLGRLLEAMDAAGIRVLINLDGFWGEHLEKALAKYYEPYPDRFAMFGSINLAEIDRPDFKGRIQESIKEMHRRGLKGIKVFKDLSLSYRDANGKVVCPSIPPFGNPDSEYLRTFKPHGTGEPIFPDDDRLRPVWEQAAELGLPVLIHIADLYSFFQPFDESNEQYALIKARPDWNFHDKDVPGFEELLEAQLRLLARNPDTNFIIAHVGSYSENLKWVADMLDAYPNAFVDIAARVGMLGRQPYTARQFFLDYQDRIVFGSDRFPCPNEPYLPWSALSTMYRFLETFDEYFPSDSPRMAPWRLYGIGLPDPVLRKIYHRNAERLIPGVSVRQP